jgi:hypothetical protein
MNEFSLMDFKLWTIIEIDEYFNIPINQWDENKSFPNLSRSEIITGCKSSEIKFPYGVSPSDPNPFLEPPNFIRRMQASKPLPDIKLVGIYSSKERAEQMIMGHPRRKLLGPTSFVQD